ncbi:hypothetical protein A3715_09220 [Oleiphilus sp. HI0009]|nr:hypothetical protein A3715_09220 [Oleiphilus sp. HI0009]
MINIKTISVLTVALFFIVALVPMLPLLAWGPYNHHRVVAMALLCFISITFCLLLFRANISHDILKRIIIAPALFFIAGGLSVIFSDDQQYSFMLYFHFFLLFALSLVLALTVDRQFYFFVILGAYFLSFAAVILVSCLNLIFVYKSGDDLSPGLVYHNAFINIRFFNQVQVFFAPLLLFLLSFEKYRRLLLVLLFLNFLLMIIGNGRGILLTTLVLITTLYFLAPQFRRLTIMSAATLVISYLAFLLLHYVAGSNSSQLTTHLRVSNYGRVDGWLDLLKDLQFHHMFYGEGPGMYRHLWGGGATISHPHNSVLQILYEWGALALIVLLAMKLFSLFVVVKHLGRNKDDIVMWSVSSMWLSGLSYSLFSGVVVMPLPQVILFALWGLVLARSGVFSVVTSDLNNPAKAQFGVSILLKLVLIAGLCVGLYVYVGLAAELSQLIKIDVGYGTGPRFWEQGVRFTDFD